MFQLEDYDSKSHKDYGKADYLRLEAGQRIRNITLTGISEGSNQYGYFCMAFFKTQEGAKGFINLSSKLVDEFTVASSSGRVLNPELRDEEIWVGKRSFITETGEKRSFLEWEFEE
ncbi:MAG: hypothetical protein PHX50_17425 [Massilibacteroides sp.]|nr:hypothetical protein [Massilibacteroides sp.]